jgi:signal transduction histidine kinase
MNTSTIRHFSLDWIILAVLLILLTALGVLQYHWLARLSRWEEDRLQAVLQAGANQLAAEISDEFDVVFKTFQMNLGVETPQDLSGQIAQSWQSIGEKTGHAPGDFIEAVFWVPPDANGKSRWRVFRVVDSHLEESEAGSPPVSLQTFVAERGRSIPSPPERLPLWDAGGDFVIPVTQQFFPGRRSTVMSGRNPAVILIVLNRRHLSEKVFPDLVRRYLGTDDNLDLASAVLNDGNPPGILYRSDPDLGWDDFVEYDIATDIFLLRSTYMMIVEEPPASGKPESTAGAEPESKRERQTGLPPADNHEPAPAAQARWRLLVRHPSGSLATAVSKARQRNLAVGFGILAVLGTSLVMLLVSTRRARNLARLQMEFVSGVSHELRTPLAVITSAGENLEDAVVDNPEGIREYGGLIRREARHLTDMLERIIQFSRFQSGHLHLDLTPTEVPPLVTGAVDSFRSEIVENDITLEQEFESDLPLVLANAEALRSALRNLISNAIKYGETGRWLRVEAGRATSGRGKTVRISVRDRGNGVPAREQSKIFQPFYRTRAARNAQVRGSGLGLSLAAEIVSAHGGELSVKSEPGKGSCFRLELPVWNEAR